LRQLEFAGAFFLTVAFDETVFLTGFPGFIASRLVKRLAAEGARFFLLVQPALARKALEETVRIAAETNTPTENFRIVEGDITTPNLGLTSPDFEAAQRETTLLFHLAAIYDLAVEREVAMRVNVGGTRHVNDFAKTIRNLRCYHYVSTCYVAGKRVGVILESELRHDAGFRNHYEETKHLAELSVAALKTDLPIMIHRPSVVCGDSKTGETAKYDGIYYLIHYLRMWPGALTLLNIGNSDVRLNLVPIDFVIEAMATLAAEEKAIGATVQLADPAPLTTRELFDEIAKALKGRESLATIPPGIVYPVLMFPFSAKLTGLPHSAVPYFFLTQTYDTARACQLLDPHGVRCPSLVEYTPTLVDFVARHPRLV